jgi:hypothetical protein
VSSCDNHIVAAGCGARRETVRHAPAGRARSLSVPRRRGIACTRALGPSGNYSSVEAFRASQEAVSANTPVVPSQIGELLKQLTEFESSAASQSRVVYNDISVSFGDNVPSVEELSSKLTEQLSGISGAAANVSSDLFARSSEFGSHTAENLVVLREELSSKGNLQFNALSTKAVQLTSELSNKSKDLSAQFKGVLDAQLESVPELKARLAAGADTFVQGMTKVSDSVSSQASSILSSDALGSMTDQFEDKVDVFKTLVSSGHLADVLATPEGIGAAAVATAGVLFGVTSAVSPKDSTSTSATTQTAMAMSSSQEASSDAASARAWIDRWRSSQVPLSTCPASYVCYCLC